MQELLNIVVLIDVRLGVGQQEIEEEVELFVLGGHHLMHEPEVHPLDIVQQLDAHDCQREHSLRQDGRLGRLGCGCLEGLVTGEQESSDHLNYAEQLSLLEYKEHVLADLVALLVDGPSARVNSNHSGERFKEGGGLKQEERDLRHFFLQLVKWQLLYNCVLRLQLCCDG